jgi:drug/metabolite transporter (DMT)-like permease
MQLRVFLLMLVSTLSFAVVNIIIKSMDNFHPFQLVFFRCSVALLICIVQIKSLGIPFFGNNIKMLLIRGVAGVTALSMFFFLIQKVSLGTAVTLQYLSPIFSAFIGVFMLKEKVLPIQWLALIIGVVGVALLQKGDVALDNWWLLLGLITAAIAGLAYNAVRVCRKTDHALTCVLYFPLLGTPLAGVASIPYWQMPQGWEWVWILLLGAFTQLAQVTLTKALQSDNIAGVTIYKYLGTVYALIVGYFVFDESINLFMLSGVALIVLGLITFHLIPKWVKKNP